MDYETKSKNYYAKSRSEMLAYLPEQPKKVLDVGCGRGSFAALVKEKKDCEVWGVEYMKSEAAKAAKVLDEVIVGPIEENLKAIPAAYFDVIFFNDVLEHLIDPDRVIAEVKQKLSPDGIIISSVPNIRYHNALIPILLEKDFKYQEHGVMDRTHLRFFTSKSIKRMFVNQGYEILLHEGINRSRSFRPILYNIPLLFTQLDIFFPQYATVVQIKQ